MCQIFWETSASIFRVINCRVPRTAATRIPKGGRKWRVCPRPGGNEKRIQTFSRQISYDKSPCRWFCRRESNKYYSGSCIRCLRLWSGLNWTRRETYEYLDLDAGLLARSQYSEGPATGHFDTDFSWFPCVCKQMLRWFPRFQVATTCFSCSPPDFNLLVTNSILCIHVK